MDKELDAMPHGLKQRTRYSTVLRRADALIHGWFTPDTKVASLPQDEIIITASAVSIRNGKPNNRRGR